MKPLVVRVALSAAVATLLCILALPMVSLLVRLSPGELLHQLTQPVVLTALGLSLETSIATTVLVILLGLPVAYLLATKEFTGKRVLQTLVEIPIVLPPTVAGVGLLLAFGRAGLAGGALKALGIELPFTTLAVVVAQVFVATPFFISAATAGLAGIERRYTEAAATLGATPGYGFFRVLLPLALPSVLAGSAMAWARALGEFGATITFAGNIQNRTQTTPLAVYNLLEATPDVAIALSLVLLTVAIVVLVSLRDHWFGGIRDARR
ncbi:MAG TPA: ABC transporter permease [Gemmatimonadales bacterium]|nr:ABC transporter permease [Gemmatimonadales bacterium]